MTSPIRGSRGTRRWLAFGAVILAETAVGLDLTVLSVALPTLSGALRASESDLQWFSSGYALVLAAAMLPAGLLGDRYGRKKVILASLALFAAGSLACAYSRTAGEFIAARVLLGLAGAGLTVMAVSVLAVLFSEQERPKAVRVWAAQRPGVRHPAAAGAGRNDGRVGVGRGQRRDRAGADLHARPVGAPAAQPEASPSCPNSSSSSAGTAAADAAPPKT